MNDVRCTNCGKINCDWCDSELLEDHDHYTWNGFKFCCEDCLEEFLEDGE